jgi:hypothetical protein
MAHGPLTRGANPKLYRERYYNQAMDSLPMLLIAIFACSSMAAPVDNHPCAKLGDTVTARGVFMMADGKAVFVPHAFPYRPFCLDVVLPAESERLRQLARIPLPSSVEGYMLPQGVALSSLPFFKYVEVTGTISIPVLGPGQFITRPCITISRVVDVDAEVRATIDVWLAGCEKWQEDNLPAFSKQVPGAKIERTPSVPDMRQRLNRSITPDVWTPIDRAPQCALSATPVSKVIVPAPQPVVLVRPEK